MANYFNTLPLRKQLEQLGKCRFMEASEFEDGVAALKDKKLHELLALVDALRVGRARERELAIIELKKRFGFGE